jgi:leucyl/phenylalanyl-tRNA--protein transferase
MLGCSARHGDENVWITSRFVDCYSKLHELGWAHSVETFNEDGVLVGGLYGVRIGKFFAGESMFHLERDASKVALMALVDVMRSAKMTLLDAQWQTPHLASLGALEIPRAEYLHRLATATSL